MYALQKDLTQGPIFRRLIVFSFPLLCANILQALYGIADMLVVGRFVGTTGLAAVSNGGMIGFIISSLCIGFSMGGTVVAAGYAGAKDDSAQREAVATLFCLSFILAACITALSLAVHKPLLAFMDTPPEAMEEAVAYTRVICAGTTFVCGYNAVCAVLRGFGDSRGPLYFVAVAAAANVILDILLVGSLGMGARGAAIATVTAQGLSFGIAVLHLRRNGFVFDFALRSFTIKRDKLAMILRVGIPAAGQMVVVNLSFLAITAMLNGYGVAVAAASGIGLKINTFAAMPCWAVGQAMAAMVAQSMGAGDIKRARRVGAIGLRVNLAVTALLVALVQVFAGPLIALFDPSDPEITNIGVRYLRLCCSFNCVLYVAMYSFDSFALGVGRPDIALFNSLLDALVAKLALAWLATSVLGMGHTGVYIGQALSPLVPAAIGVCFFYRGRWEKSFR